MKVLFGFLLLLAPRIASAADYSPEFAAQTAAHVYNEAKTMDGLLKRIDQHLTPEEMTGLRDLFQAAAKKDKITLMTALPKARSSSAVFIVDQADFRIEFKADRSLVVNGKAFTPTGPVDIDVQKMRDSVNHRAANSLSRLFLERASAGSFTSFLSATLSATTVGTVVLAAGLSIWFPAQFYQHIRYGKGKIVCDGDKFMLRTPSSGFTAKDKHLANDDDADKAAVQGALPVNMEVAKKMLNNPNVRCDGTLAESLQKMILETSPLIHKTVEAPDAAPPPSAGTQ